MTTTKKILIIDDEPDARAYLKAILDEEGYEIMTAADAEEGMKKVRESQPHLIMLDLMMPKSGIIFLNEIKNDEQLKEIPIVVASGARQVTGVDMKHYLEEQPFKERKKEVLGIDFDITPDAFLEKPVNPSELLATVKKLI
ncbi:MAG: response regulator [Candidatus Aminicenantes bacterium]|nr:MAG: response regulator [Candidatus Aminicenantes bacterium]